MLVRSLFATLVILVPTITHGGQLTLTGQALIWNPLSQPSPTLILGIENSAATTELLFAWSLGLQITASPGAVGTVQFNSVELPPDYLLAGRSGGLVPTFSGPSATIAPIGDSDAFISGVVVPSTGKNVLATTFVASPGASGQFDIAVVPDQFDGANWFSSDFQNARDFLNAPFDGGPIIIGTITIVPEPATDVLLLPVLCASAAVMLQRHAHRRRARATAPATQPRQSVPRSCYRLTAPE